MEGLRRPRVVSPGTARDRQDTIPYSVSFSVCPSLAVDSQTSANGKGQRLKQVWRVDTRSVRQVFAGSLQFQKLAVAGPLEAAAYSRPTP